MGKLHELIAVEPSLKDVATAAINAAKEIFGDVSLFAGQARNYQPLDEEGETFAPEQHLPKGNVSGLLEEIETEFGAYIDASVQKEVTNTKTEAVVILDGFELPALPATALLNLEDKLQRLKSLVNSIPTLDPSIVWQYDENQGFYASDVKTSYRSEKKLKTHVEYEATKEHPAQVQTFSVDERVGVWNTIHYSAAMPMTDKKEILRRLEELSRAVKKARQRANEAEVVNVKVSQEIFDYLFNF